MHRKYSTAITYQNTINTRSRIKINLPIPRSSMSYNSIIYFSKKLFNHLPISIRSISNCKPFKKEVKNVIVRGVNEYLSDNI